jgi:hypothetical protein
MSGAKRLRAGAYFAKKGARHEMAVCRPLGHGGFARWPFAGQRRPQGGDGRLPVKRAVAHRTLAQFCPSSGDTWQKSGGTSQKLCMTRLVFLVSIIAFEAVSLFEIRVGYIQGGTVSTRPIGRTLNAVAGRPAASTSVSSRLGGSKKGSSANSKVPQCIPTDSLLPGQRSCNW